jgi:hypothetical protein
MTEFELYEDLVDHFGDGMVTAGYILSGNSQNLWIEWPGTKLDVPTLAGDANGHVKPWIRYTYRPVDGGQVTLSGDGGSARFITVGNIVHEIFAPPYQGMQVALEIAESVRSVYDGKESSGGVWFRKARPPQVVGLTGGWFKVNVSVNFEYEFVR